MPIKYDDKGIIKRPNKEMNFTQQQLQEFINSANSVIYFAENYYYIINPVTGSCKISLRDYQHTMLNNLQNNRFNILLAARQVGKCVHFKQYVEILDTETGKSVEIPIGELYEMLD